MQCTVSLQTSSKSTQAKKPETDR